MLSESQNLLEDYFSSRVLSKGSQRVYTNTLISWDRNTEIPINELTSESLSTWYKKASKELNSTSVEKYGLQLRMLYGYSLEKKGLSKRKSRTDAIELFDNVIPFKDLRKKSKNDNDLRDKLITAQEYQAIMKVANSVRMRSLLALTLESGCRKGEIFSIRLRDIQTYDQYWTVSINGKTGNRTVPIISSVPFLRAWIQQHPDRENENSPLFVTSRKGRITPMSQGSFNTGLQLLCKNAGIRMLYPHQLRHTRLTELAEDGLGDTQLRSFAGWTPGSAMATRYVHLSGSGHVNAVLEAGGIATNGNGKEKTPFVELHRCPNCDAVVDPKWVQCPACQFILNEKMGIQRHNELEDMKAELAELKRIVEEKTKQEN